MPEGIPKSAEQGNEQITKYVDIYIYIAPKTKDGEEGKMTVPLIDGLSPFFFWIGKEGWR